MSSFWLEYEQDGSPQRFPFDGQTVSIGRDKSSDFVLDHPTVSRQHALIVSEGGGVFRLVVLSRGGLTALEGQPVASEAELYDEALLHIGRLSFRFRSDQAPKRPAHAPPAPSTPAPLQQAAGLSQNGFGSGFGQGSPSAAPAGFGVSTGNFGTPAELVSSAPVKPSKPEPAKEVGEIVSWDEIAQSDAAVADQDKVSTDFEKIQKASEKGNKEKSNPALLIIGGIAIAVMLYVSFAPTSSGPATVAREVEQFSDMALVEIKIDCLGDADCMRQAQSAYRLGVDLIERRDVENRNLFDGYRRLLETKAFLEAAGITEIPEEMDRLEPLHDRARSDLDVLFNNFRMRFHQLSRSGMHRETAEVLTSIKAFFPDATAREHRWAVRQERDMRRRGVYPRSTY